MKRPLRRLSISARRSKSARAGDWKYPAFPDRQGRLPHYSRPMAAPCIMCPPNLSSRLVPPEYRNVFKASLGGGLRRRSTVIAAGATQRRREKARIQFPLPKCENPAKITISCLISGCYHKWELDFPLNFPADRPHLPLTIDIEPFLEPAGNFGRGGCDIQFCLSPIKRRPCRHVPR